MTGLKRLLVLALMLVAVFAFGITAMAAENSGDADTDNTVEENTTEADDVATDSKANVVLEAADASISDVAKLLDGQSPSEITGNPELADYSTYSIYSVTTVSGYEFDAGKPVSLSVNARDISSDMDVKVMFLDTQGSWKNMSFAFNSGVVSVNVSEVGQVAIFRHSDAYAQEDVTEEEVTTQASTEEASTEEAATEETGDKNGGSDEGTSPKTFDNIVLFVALALLGVSGILMTSKKAFRK